MTDYTAYVGTRPVAEAHRFDVAALERFMRETAPTAAPEPPPVSGWVRAARLEAVERAPGHEPWP